jgi:hypothetical protein
MAPYAYGSDPCFQYRYWHHEKELGWGNAPLSMVMLIISGSLIVLTNRTETGGKAATGHSELNKQFIMGAILDSGLNTFVFV